MFLAAIGRGPSTSPHGGRALEGGSTLHSGQFTTGPARAKYGYDDFGQMISRDRRNPDRTYISQRLKWDGAGRLAEATDLRRNDAIFTATYTPSGQRLTKNDTASTATHTYSYGLHDTAGPTHLPGGGLQSGEGKLYALTDRLGSTRATTTAQGVVSERVSYDAWGRITAQTGPVPVGTPLYAGAWGYEREPEGVTGLGLDYLTHRYYDPQIGRFISRDPIGWAGGLNLYGYCENDPVNHTDPLGLCAKCGVQIPQRPSKVTQGVISHNLESAAGLWRDYDALWRSGYVPEEMIAGSWFGTNAKALTWFREHVRNRGPWDYKQLDSQLRNCRHAAKGLEAQGIQPGIGSLGLVLMSLRGVENRFANFGNFHFGATGYAARLDLGFMLRQAGAAQVKAGTSTGKGSPALWGFLGGAPPYGDDPNDQLWIRAGYRWAQFHLQDTGKVRW